MLRSSLAPGKIVDSDPHSSVGRQRLFAARDLKTLSYKAITGYPH